MNARVLILLEGFRYFNEKETIQDQMLSDEDYMIFVSAFTVFSLG